MRRWNRYVESASREAVEAYSSAWIAAGKGVPRVHRRLWLRFKMGWNLKQYAEWRALRAAYYRGQL